MCGLSAGEFNWGRHQSSCRSTRPSSRFSRRRGRGREGAGTLKAELCSHVHMLSATGRHGYQVCWVFEIPRPFLFHSCLARCPTSELGPEHGPPSNANVQLNRRRHAFVEVRLIDDIINAICYTLSGKQVEELGLATRCCVVAGNVVASQ
jgi:hypothetical protein